MTLKFQEAHTQDFDLS